MEQVPQSPSALVMMAGNFINKHWELKFDEEAEKSLRSRLTRPELEWNNNEVLYRAFQSVEVIDKEGSKRKMTDEETRTLLRRLSGESLSQEDIQNVSHEHIPPVIGDATAERPIFGSASRPPSTSGSEARSTGNFYTRLWDRRPRGPVYRMTVRHGGQPALRIALLIVLVALVGLMAYQLTKRGEHFWASLTTWTVTTPSASIVQTVDQDKIIRETSRRVTADVSSSLKTIADQVKKNQAETNKSLSSLDSKVDKLFSSKTPVSKPARSIKRTAKRTKQTKEEKTPCFLVGDSLKNARRVCP